MASLKQHCKHTFERYGVRGEDIHKWMDEPSQLFGSLHREWRHREEQVIPKVFIDKYGEDLARYIITDHLLLDQKEKSVYELVIEVLKKRPQTLDEITMDVDRPFKKVKHVLKQLCDQELASMESIRVGMKENQVVYTLKTQS